jgi:hypothetical protein
VVLRGPAPLDDAQGKALQAAIERRIDRRVMLDVYVTPVQHWICTDCGIVVPE